jgi:hypothetical protein
MKQQVKISQVKGNPNNPRIIKNDKFKKLKNSIKTLPNYMKLRPVIVDEDMMVLGGNMRLKASIDLGRKEIWTDMFTQADCEEMNKIAIEEGRESKTYLEYCDEIIIKDNVSSGDWEWDMLANEWDSVQLDEFGLDVWQNPDDKIDQAEEGEEIELPQALQIEPPKEYIMILCEPNSEEWEQLKIDLKLGIVRKGGYKKGSAFDTVSTERVLTYKDFRKRYAHSNTK